MHKCVIIGTSELRGGILKVAYCDNEMHCIDDFIRNYKDVFAGDDINFYTSPDELLATEPVPDVVFMDMELDGEETGLDYAEKIYGKSAGTKIVAVTAYSEKFIQDVFLKKANICGFLSKPVQREYLLKTVEKIRKDFEEHSRKIVLCEKSGAAVSEKEIIYAESEKHTVEVYTDKGVISIRSKLSELEDKLSDRFIMCHKSYMVNIERIASLRREEVTMDNGAVVPVSRSRQQDFKERYYDYVNGCME